MFVITGATGNTGSVVAQTLLDRGHAVRVVVRSAEKGEAWRAKGADVAIAEVSDAEAMAKALDGAVGAYFMLPPDLTNENFLGESLKRAEAIVEAASAAGLPHAVILSSVGAQHSERTGPISTIARMEKLFVAASIPLTAVRPGYFLENIKDVMPAVFHEGVYPSMILPLDHKIDMVATRDIGLAVADALLNPPTVAHRVVELKGAEQYSAQDIAAELSKSLGRDVAAIPVPQEAWVETLKDAGLSKQSAESMAEMHAGINDGRIAFLDADAKKATITLARFVEQLVG